MLHREVRCSGFSWQSQRRSPLTAVPTARYVNEDTSDGTCGRPLGHHSLWAFPPEDSHGGAERRVPCCERSEPLTHRICEYKKMVKSLRFNLLHSKSKWNLNLISHSWFLFQKIWSKRDKMLTCVHFRYWVYEYLLSFSLKSFVFFNWKVYMQHICISNKSLKYKSFTFPVHF